MKAIPRFNQLFSLFFEKAEEPTATKAESMRISPKEALDRLLQGNQRYMQDRHLQAHDMQETRETLINQQNPFAIVLGCSDSRASPEIIFDQSIGDLFVTRVAGNVLGSTVLDTIDYSAHNLKPSLIFVMGHENCAAVTSVLNHETADLESIVPLIEPAVEASAKMPGNRLENAVKTNVLMIVDQLKNVPLIKNLIQEGKIDVVGGYYHLDSGKVEILP